jgi:serine/threonine-protein kinase
MIGDGGMGVVYEARHEALGNAVALKFLKAELAQTPGLAARFLREARVAANIASPHVAHVSDVDTATDGSPYLVMELLSGEPLQRLLDKQSKLPMAQAIDFALQILSGLEAAHAVSVVHRDLKPDNVFVTPGPNGPFLKLLDFGIAKVLEPSEAQRGLTRSGVVMGTAEYMPPEQLYAASDVDPRADLYALGVMLFEMLSGKRPAEGGDAEVIVGKVLSGQVFALETLEPNLPVGLVGVVRRAIAADRDARFASARELRAALEPFVGQPAPERTSGAPERTSGVPKTLADSLPEAERVSPRGSTEPAMAPLVPGPGWGTSQGPPGRVIVHRRRRPIGLFVGLLLFAVAAAGAVAVLLIPHETTGPGPTPPIPPPEPSEAVIAPLDQAPPGQGPTPVATVTPPGTPGQAGPGTRPDAGAATTDGGPQTVPTVPPFQLPSTFPPLIPSGFPTALPSIFPPFPSTFPGLPPPPAQAQPPPDGGS